MDYNNVIGYDVFAKVKESKALPDVGQFLASNKIGAICGGAAVVIHVGKEVRQVTPDLDVIVKVSAIPAVLAKYGNNVTRNSLGFSNVVDGMETDWLFATQLWQEEAIQHAIMWHGIPVIDIEYLVISKIISNRDKDKHDLQLIFNKKGLLPFHRAVNLLEKYGMDEVADELKSEMHVLPLVAQANMKTP